MLKKAPYPNLVYHALAWAIFITYEVSFATILKPSRAAVWEWMFWYTLNISLFYFFAHVVLGYTLKYKKTLLLLILVPVTVMAYVSLHALIDITINPFRTEPRVINRDKLWLLGVIWRCIYFMGFSTAYWFVFQTKRKQEHINHMEMERLKAQHEKAELEKGLIRSENAFLQAQISPHLLFNTLNFIYNSVQDISPKASEGVLLLSDVMHYALQRVHEDGKTDLQHEMEHIEKYITLNQLRFKYPLYLQLRCSGRPQGRIPPLLLLTFVENTFKHGDLTDSTQSAYISISHHQGFFHFSTSNKKRKHHGSRGYGIGIENAKTRLREHYQEDDYTLTIEENEQRHTVDLKIKLT